MDYKDKVLALYKESGIKFTEDELASIEYADFGLDNIEEEGLNLIVYVNNDRYCAKEMVLLPGQTCPEHRHPRRGINKEIEGKQETFRVRQGLVYLYVEGAGDFSSISAKVPDSSRDYYTISHEIILCAGEQYTINPDIKHWFQAGPDGAIVSEFSSPSDDASDIFTNPNIKR
ncbi:D-lyxose isomerase [Streptococcus agalactiae LMG 14747]|uniref:D-lyxose ketol-isomerase n=1 Tax=Streptococcus agalactiae LMG 14747 TaxID=1154860 RepID=V6YZH4_STRAG|nr:D-lyxose isomerase [Streptococcus agalactiae LMG 14747]